MDERQRIVREIFLEKGRDWKLPINRDEWECYDYEEGKIIRKELTRGELKKLLMEREYTEEEAKEIISECWLRNIITIMGIGSSSSEEENICRMINEEDLVRNTVEDLAYCVSEIKEELGMEIKDYIIDEAFDENDEDEIKLREVYAEQNKKELSKTKLIQQLKEKGYTDEEAEQIIDRHTDKKEEKTKWKVEDLFHKTEYKLLKHHTRTTTELDEADGELIAREKSEEYYEITLKDEWLLKEYSKLLLLRAFGGFIYGTDKVPFRTIKKILQEAWEQGIKALTHKELKQKIIEERSLTEEDAEVAIDVALRTFKITELDQSLEEIWRMKHTEELKYYWSGTTNEYPPLTTQDRIFNPLKQIFEEVAKQGKETLTHEELVQKALETYQNQQKKHEFNQTREVNRELIETLIEDAESLLLIKTSKNGEKTYNWNSYSHNMSPSVPNKK